MRRAILFTISLLAMLSIGAPFGLTEEPLAVETKTETTEGLGICAPSRWVDYLEISEAAAPLRFGGGPLEFADGAYHRFRYAFSEHEFTTGQTHFVAVAAESGEMFVATCAEEKCTAQEASEAAMTCLRNGGAICATIALVFRDESFCLAYPRS